MMKEIPMASPETNNTDHSRIESIDLLRGIVMVIMALDHVRDHFTSTFLNTSDLLEAAPSIFITRWITHFCAPVFFFLAGTAAFLSGSYGKTKTGLSRLLFVRGLWLVVLELTVIRLAWAFNFEWEFVFQVIWALGWSMVVLAGMVFLPIRVIAVVSLMMIAGHNLLDGVNTENLGSFGWLWMILHEFGLINPLPGVNFFVVYPLIPWVGVMSAGYCFGRIMLFDKSKRQKWLLMIGTGLILAFIVIRAFNLYGDPNPWVGHDSVLLTIFSFVNCEKYPPSLLYLLMTLGPAIMILALLEKASGFIWRFIIVFGRVPLFYYILHLYLIHAMVLVIAFFNGFDIRLFFTWYDYFPQDFRFSLPVVYLLWIVIIMILYPVCRWYAGLKATKRYSWLRFL